MVDDDRLSELGVGHDDQVIGEHAQPGRAPAEVGDVAFLAGIQLDVVAESDLTGERDEEPGKEVRQRLLQRQRHGQAADAERGEHRRNRQARGR